MLLQSNRLTKAKSKANIKRLPAPDPKRKVVQLWLLTLESSHRLLLSLRGQSLLGFHICGVLRRTFHSNRLTPCREKLVTTHNYCYTSEKTSAPAFFTLRRLNSPRITIEKRATTRVKTLTWERSTALGWILVLLAALFEHADYTITPEKVQWVLRFRNQNEVSRISFLLSLMSVTLLIIMIKTVRTHKCRTRSAGTCFVSVGQFWR